MARMCMVCDAPMNRSCERHGLTPPPKGKTEAEILAETHADFAAECTAAMMELRVLVQSMGARIEMLETSVAILQAELAGVRGLAMRS